ncbi:glucose-6-phosphate exchanger SLC37A4-like [Oratosquilla oratoria]|uniref:glucose-6-phosphate exchanger SLC37A4-like n=1 Tax=Oratosquilla oratoria TaxID=337810 RepID=UPI003F7742B0
MGEGNVLVRYQGIIFTTLFVGYASYTYNRKSVAYVLPSLLTSGLITKANAGVINSCQNTAYAISKFAGGILSDRISARILFSSGLVLSGISVLLFTLTTNTYLWAALWFLNGLAQGAGWPACGKFLKKWYSPARFGTFWSILTASSNVSGTIFPLVSAAVLLRYGWTSALVLSASVSLVVSCVALLSLVDDPTLVGLPSPAAPVTPSKDTDKETSSSPSTSSSSSSSSTPNMTAGELALSPFLWLVSISYMVVFCAKTAVTDWGQIFVMENLGRSQMQASAFTSALETGGFCGGILAGVVTDRMSSLRLGKINPRLLVAAGFMALCGVGLHLLQHNLTEETSQVLVSSVGFLLGASMFGPISIFGIVASESYPTHLSGTAHAVVALAANVGAISAGWPLSQVARVYSWSGVFTLLEALSMSIVAVLLSSGRLHIMPKAKVQ